MMSRFVYLRTIANGQAFPSGIIDTVTQETLYLENDIMKVMDFLNKVYNEELKNDNK